jgi:hypothetical protein
MFQASRSMVKCRMKMNGKLIIGDGAHLNHAGGNRILQPAIYVSMRMEDSRGMKENRDAQLLLKSPRSRNSGKPESLQG